MIFCLHENKPIAVSKARFVKGQKVVVSKEHWSKENAKYIKGYEMDLENAKVGDKVFCPVCNNPVDFRMWMSDTEPTIS
jgi:hypothetical protein